MVQWQPLYERGELLRPLLFFFSAVAAYFLVLSQFIEMPIVMGAVVSAIHFFLACWIYLRHGGALITPLGLFSISSAAFLAMAFLFIWPKAHHTDVVAALSAAFCFSLTAALALRYPSPVALSHSLQQHMIRLVRPAAWLGVCLAFLVLAFQFKSASSVLYRAAGPSVLVSYLVSVAMAVLLFNSRRLALCLVFAAVSLLAFYLYYEYFFWGHGRLRIVLFGTIAAVIVSTLRPIKLLKPLSLAAFPVLLFWAGASEFDTYTTDDFLSAKNLGSLYSPFETFSQIARDWGLWTEVGLADWGWGSSYLNILGNYVPRTVWPSKPEGLGRIYTYLIRPDLAHTGHTLSGSYLGELWANFWWFGLMIGPVLIASVLGRLSKFQRKIYGSDPEFAFFWLLLYALFVAGIADFVWADSNTYTHRIINTAVVLFFAALPLILTRRHGLNKRAAHALRRI